MEGHGNDVDTGAMQALERLLHPDLRDITLSLLPLLESIPPLSEDLLPLMREMVATGGHPALPKPTVKAVEIAGIADSPGLSVHVVNCQPGARLPAVLYLHGGGFVAGTPAVELSVMQEIARDLACVVVAPQYRLAPEASFPAPVDDAEATLRWMHAEATALGIDTSRVALFGRSAGGGLAAMLSHRLRAEAELAPCVQILLYPMLDDRTGAVPGQPARPLGPMWTAQQNQFGWQALLGAATSSDAGRAAAVPGRYTDVAGTAPTWISVGTLDLFAEENLAYALRLLGAGTPVELHLIPGVWHGFDLACPDTPISRSFRENYLRALRCAFA